MQNGTKVQLAARGNVWTLLYGKFDFEMFEILSTV